MVGMRIGTVLPCMAAVLLAAMFLTGCSEGGNRRAAAGDREQRSRGAGAVSAQPAPASQGPILWQADFETGDLSQWDVGNRRDAMEEADSGRCSRPDSGVSTEQAHSGQYSMKMVIDAARTPSGCRQFRKAETASGLPLYYSAWFYFPERVTVGSQWNIFQFKAKAGGKSALFWKLDVRNNPAGDMVVILVWKGSGPGPQAGDGVKAQRYVQSLATLPVGQWVHLEVYLKQSEQFDGQLTVWQDGVQLFDMAGVRTKQPGGVQNWSINNYGLGLEPSPTTLYIDDAAISTERIGP
jgi:hypothetical protein